MQTYVVDLKSELGKSYRCQKASDSVNLKTDQKDTHHLEISIDLETPFNLGLIHGPSGSGKTSLAREMFGEDFDFVQIDPDAPVIDQFPKEMKYEDVVDCLTGMGLTSIPCWVRPFKTLSNGQQARALAALALSSGENITVIDEWTSVVDRTVAKAMSLKIQKEVRKKNKKVILLSCHTDVMEWINPDWVVDCATSEYMDRRREVEGFERKEKITFQIEECKKKMWKFFSKYHYLSQKIAPRTYYTFGLYHEGKQIGFCAYTNYSFHNRTHLHSNRVVIHPDYIGFGLGIKMVTITSKYLHEKGHRVSAKFTSVAMLKSRIGHPNWRFMKKEVVDNEKKGAVLLLKSDGRYHRKNKEDIPKLIARAKSRNKSKLFHVVYYLFDFVDAMQSDPRK